MMGCPIFFAGAPEKLSSCAGADEEGAQKEEAGAPAQTVRMSEGFTCLAPSWGPPDFANAVTGGRYERGNASPV